MSLLNRGQDRVLVWPEIVATDSRGNPGQRMPADEPVAVYGRVRPVSSDESDANGQEISTLYRLTARSVPAGAWSRVHWDGLDWDTVGEPERHHGSPRTQRVTVLLRARTPRQVAAGKEARGG